MRGFSLLEMLVVVAIVAIAATFAIPNIAEMVSNSRSREEMRNVGDVLNKARNLARNTNQCVELKAQPGSTGLKIIYKRIRDCGDDAEDSEAVQETRFVLFKKINTDTPVIIDFNRAGGIDANAGAKLRLFALHNPQLSWGYRITGKLGLVEELR